MTVSERLTALLDTFKHEVNNDLTRYYIETAVRHFLMDTQANGDLPAHLPLDVQVTANDGPHAVQVMLAPEMEAFLSSEAGHG